MENNHLDNTKIKIINYILKRFNTDFYFINKHKKNIINLLINNNLFKVLINNKTDTIDNEYIDYYDKKYKELVINNFLNNIYYLSHNSYLIDVFIKDNNISNTNYNETYKVLKDLSLSNVNSFNIILLFQNINDYEKQFFKKSANIKRQTLEHFTSHYESMIKEYYSKKETINTLNL